MTRVLTLTQPWATLVVAGVKRIETRSWTTSYRGPLVIHAAKGWPMVARWYARELYDQDVLTVRPDALPLGALIGRVELAAVVPVDRLWAEHREPGPLERRLGDYSIGRYGWLLARPEPMEPRPWRGMLGLWSIDDRLLAGTPR